MNYTHSNDIIPGRPVLKIVLSFILFIFLCAVFGIESNAFDSFISVSLCALVSLLLLGYWFRFFFGQKILFYISAFLIIKLLIGTIHWLWLVHPNYFDQPFNFIFNWEYVWTHWSSDRIATYRLENGYFSDVIYDFSVALDFNKGFVIFVIISELYYWGGSYALNISVINTLFTFYTAFIVGIIAFHYYKEKSYARLAFTLVVFQGMTLIPSTMMRDVIGQGLIALAVLLTYQCRKSVVKSLLILPITCLFFFAQRLLYVVIPLLVFGYQLVTKESKFKWHLRFLIIPIAFLLVPQILSLFEFSENVDHFTGGSESKYSFVKNPLFFFTLPLQILKGLIGVFPWYQFFEAYDDLNGKVYYPMEYIQSIMNIVVLYLMWILVYLKKFKFSEIEFSGLILALYGFMSGDLHTGYISIGFIFFLPNIVSFTRRKILYTFLTVLLVFIVANLLYYTFGLDGSNPTEFFKYKNF